MNGDPLGAFRTPLAAIEANLLITGIEAYAAIGGGYYLLEKKLPFPICLWGNPNSLWGNPNSPAEIAGWSILALVGIILLGLLAEGFAGHFELWVFLPLIRCCRQCCATTGCQLGRQQRNHPRVAWIINLIIWPLLFCHRHIAPDVPDESTWYRNAQQWIWESPQANQEFARRRLRILLSRNSAIILLAFTAVMGCKYANAARPEATLSCSHRNPPLLWQPEKCHLVACGCFAGVLLLWHWRNAQQGYNAAVDNARLIGRPTQ